MKNTLLLCCFLTVLVGCKKEPVPAEHSKQVILPCSQSNNWTPESIDKALQGNWLLYRVETENEQQQSVPYTRLTFSAGHLLVYNMPHSGASHTGYVVEKRGANLGIRTDDDVAGVVTGNLHLCGDYLICSASAVDGSDLFYKRD